ncbi:MAG: NfeD family protein [Clostridia bacterium]|nr:NfeD family protein [Clostridia bacterium]
MMTWFWLGVLVLSIIVEAATMGLVAVWFIPGIITALVLALFDVGAAWQITAFLVLSVVVLIFGRKFFRPFNKKEKTNAEALIGQIAIITEQVCNVEGRGTAKLNGQEWSARAEQETVTLEVGDRVEVVDIRGVKLICRKQS